jgi:hypothetical protein
MQRKTHKIKPERTSTREGRTLNIFSINFEFLLTAAENTIEKCPERASELTCTKIIIATRNTGNREVEKKNAHNAHANNSESSPLVLCSELHWLALLLLVDRRRTKLHL